MTGKKSEKEAIRRIAQKEVGASARRGMGFTIERGSSGELEALVKAGAIIVFDAQVQDLDPTSPDFGKFYPVTGIDV